MALNLAVAIPKHKKPAPSKFVMGDIPIMTNAMSAYPFSEGIRHLYTFKTPFDEEVCAAIQVGNTIWVPRESAPYACPATDHRAWFEPKPFPAKVQFRHEQEGLCLQSIALLNEGKSHIFEAPTGWGKTIAGSFIAARIGQPTLIIVNKEDLLDQWRDALRIIGVPQNMVGHIQADVEDWQGKQFVIGMVQSLMVPGKYPPEMFNYFGLVILDEAHQMAADCFIKMCQWFSAKLRLGFSATPNRKDGKTKLLHWHIGQVMVKGTVIAMPPKILVKQTGWKIPTTRKLEGNEWVYKPIPHAPGRMVLVLKALCSHEGRNLEITHFVKQSFDAGRRILILSDLKEDHLNRLFQMICNRGIAGNEIGFYVGGLKKHERELAKTRRIVLGTYAMCATGTDVPAWDTLVMASPRADIKQPVGRVMRAAIDKKQPVILDLVDWNPIFQSFHLSRVKQYHALQAKIVKM